MGCRGVVVGEERTELVNVVEVMGVSLGVNHLVEVTEEKHNIAFQTQLIDSRVIKSQQVAHSNNLPNLLILVDLIPSKQHTMRHLVLIPQDLSVLLLELLELDLNLLHHQLNICLWERERETEHLPGTIRDKIQNKEG